VPGVTLVATSSLVAPTIALGLAILAVIALVALQRARPAIFSPTRRGERLEPSLTHPGMMRKRVRGHRRRQRTLRIALLAGAILILLDGLHVYRGVADLRSGETALVDSVKTLGGGPDSWSSGKLDAAVVTQGRALRRIRTGRDELRSDPLLLLASIVPVLSDQVTPLYHLADAGLAAATAEGAGIRVARDYEVMRAQAGPPGQRLVTFLQQSSPALQDADHALNPVVKPLREDLRRPLIGPVRTQVQRAVDLLGPRRQQVALAAQAARIVPGALGAQGSSHYLVLFANPSELRPAGGFIGVAGTLTFDAGQPKMTFKGAESYDPPLKHQFPVPYPLSRYLTFIDDTLGIGDAGWDPDFPATAKLSETMYTKSTGQTVDGTIQVDPYAVAAMLDVTGPIDVPGQGRFDSGNLFAKLNYIVNVQRNVPGAGKDALAPITQTILNRVLTQPSTSYQKLLTVLADQARGRHILVSLHDQGGAQVAAQAHLDGALLNPAADYMMVVDANVGATKGDYYVKKSINFKAEVPAQGSQRHQVVLTYDMPPVADATDALLNTFDGGAYHDYLRVYLPEKAAVEGLAYTLDGSATSDRLDLISFEHGHEVVGAFARVPRGHRVQLTLDYTVPGQGGRSYNLYIQKQAGTPPTPMDVTVSYPGGRLGGTTTLAADYAKGATW
jgi:hypothetical protein